MFPATVLVFQSSHDPSTALGMTEWGAAGPPRRAGDWCWKGFRCDALKGLVKNVEKHFLRG